MIIAYCGFLFLNITNLWTVDTYDYGDTCIFCFISLIIKGGFMITHLVGYACGWLRLIILREGEFKLHTMYLFGDGRNKKNVQVSP